MRTPWILASLLCIAAACGGPARPTDLAVRERSSGGGRVAEQTTYYAGRKTVVDGERQRTVIDLDAKTITMIDKASKSYAVTTFDNVRGQGDALKKRFDALPPEEQQKMTGGDQPVTTKATGKTEQIAGYEATEYLVEVGPLSGSIWVTEAVEPPAVKHDWETTSSSMRGFTRIIDRFSDALLGLKGLPLRKVITTTRGDDKSVGTTEVLEVIASPVPAEMLTVPEGYNKVALPGQG